MNNDSELPMGAGNNNMIKRQGIISAFNQFNNYRIIAVCAPAGYGKTVAVSQWLDGINHAKAIFSSDEYDNNLGGFCERFCAALRRCQPRNQTLHEITSHLTFQKAPDEFTLRAVETLANRKQAVLVIDDLHLIHKDSILRLLFVLIKRLPKNFQIILISRHELPSAFSDLWLKEQAISIGINQLLFSDDEVRALYRKRGKQITQEQAKDINQQAHGWAIGIKASLLSNGESFDKVYNYMEDFVRKNIWEKWDNETREFMVRTAFLRELTPDLCENMTGISNSKEILKELMQNGSFTTQVRVNVYHYHHLFQQFLMRIAEEREESFVMSLLETEGHWHLSKNDFYSAIECFIQGKNHDGIEQCYSLLKAESYFAVERLLPIFNHSEFIAATKKYPHLLYLAACGAFAEGCMDNATFFMDEYYARYPEIVAQRPDLIHCINYVRMLDFRLTLNQVMEQIVVPDDMSSITASIWRLSMHSPQMHRGTNNFTDLAIGDVVANVSNRFSPKIGWLYRPIFDVSKEIVTAGFLYEQGNLDTAHEYALKSYSMLQQHHSPDAKNCAMIVLVYILDAIGETKGVKKVIRSFSQMIEKDRAYHLYDNFNAFIAYRKIVSGDVAAAMEWLSEKTDDRFSIRKIYTAFITCRALILTKNYEEAIIMLTKILEMASASNRHLDTIETKILLAIAYWKKRGRFQKKALEYLEEATLLAVPYDFVQMFINNGTEIYDMLRKLQSSIEQRNTENKEHFSFIRKLHLNIQRNDDFDITDELQDAILKFNDRQKDILYMLCQGKAYKDIADSLSIKKSSVATHIRLIYKKLDVTNISDAVKKANSIGLFEN